MNKETLAGIDLGTTYSALAVLNELGKPEIVPDLNSNRIVPSVVHFASKNHLYVGNYAKNKLNLDPQNVIQFVKRQMANPSYRYNINGNEYSPIDISAFILKKLKNECIQLGKIKDVVITVPAHFDEVQRKSTMDAGKIAELNVLGIINEPTAAAIYYSSIVSTSGNVVVYDLGGGTFDVTIIKVNGNNIEALAAKGDGNLGGVDFDNEIVKLINNKAKEKFGKYLFDENFSNKNINDFTKKEKLMYFKSLEEAEKQKKALSIREAVEIRLTTPLGDLSFDITRKDFEESISSYIAITEMLIENALEDANLKPSDISKVLLVGGSTRMPVVSESLNNIFGFPPEKPVNVDEAVALGAAIYAGMKKNSQPGSSTISAIAKAEIAKTKLREVCNKNFGTLAILYVESLDADALQNTIILKKNTPIPCEYTEEFTTIFDGQRNLTIKVTESEENVTNPDHVSIIGTLKLALPLDTPANSLVYITYAYDSNQRLKCTILLPDDKTYESTICYDDKGNLHQDEMKRKQTSLNDFIIG